MEQKTKIVILGGSFNPPTKAHGILMAAAMQSIGAEQGIFVPSSRHYVERKNARGKNPNVLTENDRLEMLLAMCGDGTSVDTCEYGDMSSGRTLQTLDEIQAKHPGCELHFIMGCDKLGVFPRWKTAAELLSRHHLLWVGRDGTDGDKAVNADPFLSRYKSMMSFMPSPADTEGISSSGFWSGLANGDASAYGMLEPDVADLVSAIVADALPTYPERRN